MSERGQVLLGEIVIVEHRLDTLVREDDAISIYAATSTVDGGTYTVAIAWGVTVDTASTALETAVERSGRHAVGVRGLLPLLHARPVVIEGTPRLGVVRRGAPLPAVAELFDGSPRSVGDIVRLLTPVADALLVLHDQGLAHGAVSSSTVVRRGSDLALDLFGLSQAAEVADGARGTSSAAPIGYRGEELLGSMPGPYSDTFALAVLAAELLDGRGDARGRAPAGARPTPRALGLQVADRVETAFARALSASPSLRPSVTGFLRELAAAAADPIVATPIDVAPSVDAPVANADAGSLPTHPLAPPAPAPTPAPRPALLAPVIRYRAPPDPAGKLLAWGIALGLALFAAAMAGTTAFVLSRPAPAATSAAPVLPLPPSPISPPPVAPSTPSTALTPPRTGGPTTYPSDHDALIPVEADAIVRGDRDALLTLVLFADLTDPFTLRELGILGVLEARYGGDVRVTFKHFPLPGQKESALAAEATAVAQAHGGDAAWKFVEAAARGRELDAGRLEDLGIKAGLPAGTITQGLSHHSAQKLVERDVELGRRLGVRGTPVMFFNGRRVDGLVNTEVLERFLDAEIRRARAELGRGTARENLYATRVRANVTTSEGEKLPDAPTGSRLIDAGLAIHAPVELVRRGRRRVPGQ